MNDGWLRRKRNLSDMLPDTFTFLFDRLPTFALIEAPLALISLPIGLWTQEHAHSFKQPVVRPDGTLDFDFHAFWQILLVAVFISALVNFIVGNLTSAAIVAVIAGVGSEHGEGIAPGEAWRRAVRHSFSLFGATIRRWSIILLLYFSVLGIPWAIKRYIAWSFAVQAIMVDGATAATALATSGSLVKGHWWSTLGRLIVISILAGLVAGVIEASLRGTLPAAAIALIGFALTLVSGPFVGIASTLIYFDLKQQQSVTALA